MEKLGKFLFYPGSSRQWLCLAACRVTTANEITKSTWNQHTMDVGRIKPDSESFVRHGSSAKLDEHSGEWIDFRD